MTIDKSEKLEDPILLKRIIEAAIMAAEKPLNKKNIVELFDEQECPEDQMIEEALTQLQADCEKRGYELVKVASGYRFQVKQELSPWIGKLWKEKAPRYSRALLETLALIAYRQPITRGEIESVRGVAVSSQIIRTLLEREWIKAVGHRDVPGRPAIYATTRGFLDYFNLKSLDQLPPLAELRDLNAISEEFNIEMPPELAEQMADEQSEGELQAANDDLVSEEVASESSDVEAEIVEESDVEEGVSEEVAVELTDQEELDSVVSEQLDDEGEVFGDLERISAQSEVQSEPEEQPELQEIGASYDQDDTQLTESAPDTEQNSEMEEQGYGMMASSEQNPKSSLDC